MKQFSEKSRCRCNDLSTLVIDKIAASRLVAGLLLCSFFVFLAGYFLGKRNCAEETIAQNERTAFADQLTYAMNTAYNIDTIDDLPETAIDQKNKDQQEAFVDQKVQEESTVEQPKTAPAQDTPTLQYQAYLFGGTKKAVTQFADRLQKKGIKVQVLQRSSRTAQGKMIHWYQAVTYLYPLKDELVALVDTIKKIEKLKDVQIVVVS